MLLATIAPRTIRHIATTAGIVRGSNDVDNVEEISGEGARNYSWFVICCAVQLVLFISYTVCNVMMYYLL